MFIVIEGVDASGKETQTGLLCGRFPEAKRITFPNYESPSSTLVKMYLNGDFGKSANDVSAYAASVLFACDRFASYRTEWKEVLDKGGTVICDRYVSSNLIHQTCKIDDKDEKIKFINWLEDFEYNLMGIPKADFTIFLDMPIDCAKKLMAERNNKITGEAKKDIHEADGDYIEKAYNNAVSVAEMKGWHIIKCAKDGVIKSPEQISNEIYEAVLKFEGRV